MVSESVIIGAGSAGGTFLVLCIGALIYICWRRTYSGKAFSRHNHRGFRKVTDSNGTRISLGPPPTADVWPIVVNERKDNEQQHVLERTGSVVLPAITTGKINLQQALQKQQPQQQQHQQLQDEQTDGHEEQAGTSVTMRGKRTLSSASKLGQRPFSGMDYDQMDTSVVQQSVASLLSSSKENSPLGKLHFQLDYNRSSRSVRVTLLCAVDLPAMDVTGKSDPYVVVTLVNTTKVTTKGKLPSNCPTWRSKYHKKTLNPEFKESHDFPVPPGAILQLLALLLCVYDRDRLGSNDVIGHVWVKLSDHDLQTRPKLWLPLQRGDSVDIEEADIPLGELTVAISYAQDTRILSVIIRNAKHLPKIKAGKAPDPLVKLCLIYNGWQIAKHKTATESSTQSPFFNTMFTMQLDDDTRPQDCVLSLMVKHQGFKGTAPLRLGVVTIGGAASGLPLSASGRKQWMDVMEADANMVERQHTIRAHTKVVEYQVDKKQSNNKK